MAVISNENIDNGIIISIEIMKIMKKASKWKYQAI